MYDLLSRFILAIGVAKLTFVENLQMLHMLVRENDGIQDACGAEVSASTCTSYWMRFEER